MNFTAMMAALDGAVELHLCDDGILTIEGGEPMPMRIMIDFPVEVERLQGMSFTRARPVVSVSYAAAPDLREGDALTSSGLNWRIASAPSRSGDGRWWQAEIEPTE